MRLAPFPPASGVALALLAGCGDPPPPVPAEVDPTPAVVVGADAPAPAGEEPPTSLAPEAAPGVEPVAPGEATAGGDGDVGEPVAAVREFLTAMMAGDEERLRAATLPVEGLELLVGPSAPPEMLDRLPEMLPAMAAREMAVGEEFSIPSSDGPKPQTVTPEMSNADRRQVTGPQTPIPFIVVRTADGWKVDPSPLIAGRRAAAASRAGRDG